MQKGLSLTMLIKNVMSILYMDSTLHWQLNDGTSLNKALMRDIKRRTMESDLKRTTCEIILICRW